MKSSFIILTISTFLSVTSCKTSQYVEANQVDSIPVVSNPLESVPVEKPSMVNEPSQRKVHETFGRTKAVRIESGESVEFETIEPETKPLKTE